MNLRSGEPEMTEKKNEAPEIRINGELVRVGDEWETRDGSRVRILATDCPLPHSYQIVTMNLVSGCVLSLKTDGRLWSTMESKHDLIRKRVPPPPLWEGHLWVHMNRPWVYPADGIYDESKWLELGWIKIHVREVRPDGD